ncbi:MAG TPA: hypothetical protein VK539_10570 [Myxococcaceae bacterium]|nr:hypothetical protein [Myxococcaceae bacterium]
MHPLTSRLAVRPWGAGGLLLLLSLAAPALAAGPEVDGIVIGQTRCEDAVRTVFAQDRARVQAATHVLYLEESQRDEKKALEQIAQGPEKPGLDEETCFPYGWMSSRQWVTRALSLVEARRINYATLGLKQCPYDSRLFSVSVGDNPDVGLYCMDGVVAVYDKRVPVEMPKVRQELTAKYGSGSELGIDATMFEWATEQVKGFHSAALFTHADGQILLVGPGDPEAPVRYTTGKGGEYQFTMPKKLVYAPKSDLTYLSKAVIEALQSDKRIYEKLVAPLSAKKKKGR